ncbi:MAG: copper chaperone PCu(A)C [Paracoccus sp. (in: a-proteobacteria)]|nr:copper chaperone PCu(A)C [Paracoccus sp. (in: a-proteobacteria)]
MKNTGFAALIALALPALALAAPTPAIEIVDGYARTSNPRTGAAFFTIRNHGADTCSLVSAASDLSERTELHTHRENADGMMEMLPMEEPIAIAAGAEHVLKRGGDHVMFMGLNAPLENGQEVAFSLDFGDCGKVDVTLPVDNDRKPEEAAHSGH